MKKAFFSITLFIVFISASVYAQRVNIEKKAPASGWVFTERNVTLNGRRFNRRELSQSWREQSGYAMVNNRRLFFWLYDTISYHGGNADQIYNRYLPDWVEGMGYTINYDDIRVYDPNPDLASSIKALMQQRNVDVGVTITTGPIGPPQYDIDYLIVIEWSPSRKVYKTTIYPLLLFYKGF